MNDDDSLSALLKTWRHQPSEVSDFNRAVWARVRVANEAAAKPGFLGQLLSFHTTTARWAMPLAASVVILLSLAAGSSAALAYESLTRNERLATAYARLIDPLQMSTPHTRP